MSSSTSATTQIPKSFKVGVQLMQDAVPAAAVSVGTGAYNQEALFANPFKQAREEALVINKENKLTYLERTEASDTGWDQAVVPAATGTFTEVVVVVHPTGDVWAFAVPTGGGAVQSFVLEATGAGPNGTVVCGWKVREATPTPWTVTPNVAPQALAVSYSPDAGPLVMGATLHNGILYISSLSASPKAFATDYHPWVPSGPCSIAAQSGRLVGGGFVPVTQHADLRRKSYVYYVMDGSVLRRISTAEGAGVKNETVSSTVKQFCGTYNVPNVPQYAPQGDIGHVFLDANDDSLVTGYGNRLYQDHSMATLETAKAWQDADGKLHIFGQDASGSLCVLHQADWLYWGAVYPVWTQAGPERPVGPGIDGWDCLNPADQLFAFDFEGSGKADHLLAYRPVDGQAKVWVMKRTADGFKEVLVQNFPYSLGTGDLMCPFDYQHAGKLDHIIVYRPGTGSAAVLKANAAQAKFDRVYSSTNGIGNADLKNSADRIVAVDYSSSGRLDNLAIYRPGGRTVWIVQKGTGDSFETMYQSRTAGAGDGIGGYDMADSRDQLIAFDLDGSGKRDHLVAYRPGVGSLFLLQRKSNSRDYQALLTSTTGIGGFRLADAGDRLAPFNYGDTAVPVNKPDHLVGYNDNTFWILQKKPSVPNQPPAYASVYTSNTIGGFGSFLGRRVMSFDYTASGRADHLIVYAPGPRTARGLVTIVKSVADLFLPVYRSPSIVSPVVVGVHANVAEYRLDPYPDYKPSQLIKVSGATAAEAYCLCTQDITTSLWAVDKVRRALAKESKEDPIVVSRYVADATLLDAADAPIPGRNVTITADSLAEVHVGTASYQVGPGRPIVVATNGAGRLSVAVDAHGLSSPILTLTTDGLSAGYAIEYAAAVNGYLAGTGSLPSRKGAFNAEALRTAQAVGDDGSTEPLVPSSRWSRDLQPQAVVDHCSTVYSMAAGTTTAAFPGLEQAQPVAGYVFQNWDPDRPRFQAFRTEDEIAAYHDHRIGHPAYGGFWDDFAQWATDVWEGVKTGAARVAEVVVDVKKSIVKIAIWMGDAIVSVGEIIINSIGQAARAVEAVFQMVADAATRVIDWLKSLFAFSDIWDTKKALKSGLRTTLDYASTTVTHFSDISDDWFKEQEQKVRTAFAQAKAYFADSRIGDAQNKAPSARDASGKVVEADKAQSDPQGNWLINQVHGHEIRHPGAFTVNNTAALSAMGDAWSEFLTRWELSGVGDALGRAVDDIKELLEGLFSPDEHDPGRTSMVLLLDAVENLVIALLEAIGLVVRAFLALAVSVYKTIEEALFAPLKDPGYLATIYKWVQERAGVAEGELEDVTYGDLFLLIGAFMGTVFYKLVNGVDKAPFPLGVFPVLPPPPWHPDHAAFVAQDPPKNSDGLMAVQMVGNFLSGILCTLGGVLTDLPWAPTGSPLPEDKVNAFGNAFSTLLGYVAMGYPGIYGVTDFSDIAAAPWVVWCVFSAPCVATIVTGAGSFKNMEHFNVGPLATTGFGLILLILYIMGNVHSEAPPVTWFASVLTPVPLMTQSIRWVARKYPIPGPKINAAVTGVDAFSNLASFWAAAIGAGVAAQNAPSIVTRTLPSAQVGMDFNAKLQVDKGKTPISGWQVVGDTKLPEGLTLDKDTGDVKGSPIAVGTGTTIVTVQCHDSNTPPLYSNPAQVSVPAALTSPVQAVAKHSGDNQTAPTGTRYLTALAVLVTDAAGQALPQAVVMFTTPSTGPSANFADGTTTCRAVSDSRGLAVAADLIAGPTAGSFRVEAQVPGVSAAAVAFDLACTQTDVAGITPAPASTPQTANTGTTFAHGLTVTVKNAAGAAVPNAWVVFTAPAGGASGTFANGTASWAGATGADGTVTADAFTANGTVGDYPVRATVNGVPGLEPAIFQLGNRKLQAKALAPNGGSAPQNVVVNTRLADNLSVTVTDEQGAPYPNASVIFRAPGTGATGTFPGGKATYQAVTNADGIAVAGEFTANGTKGQYSVVATLFENSSLSTSFTIVNI